MLFADKSDSKKKMSLLSALINIKSSKIVDISASTGVLVKKTKDIEEVRLLLSKYPDAEVEVNRYPGHCEIIYWVDRHVSVSEGVKHPSWRTLSMWIEMTAIFHKNNTQFYINDTNNYVIDASCTSSVDFPCFIGNERVLEGVNGHLVYVINGRWSDGRSSPMYYCVDARSGRILWSYVGEDSYPELRASG